LFWFAPFSILKVKVVMARKRNISSLKWLFIYCTQILALEFIIIKKYSDSNASRLKTGSSNFVGLKLIFKAQIQQN
jgi:hypothetical protein